jgi:hypothetical protein
MVATAPAQLMSCIATPLPYYAKANQTKADRSKTDSPPREVIDRPKTLWPLCGQNSDKRLLLARHEVKFYSNDRHLLEHVTRFIGAALKAGDAAIILNGVTPGESAS